MKDNEWQPVETAPTNKQVLVKITYGIGSPCGAIGELRRKLFFKPGWYIDEECLEDCTVLEWMDLPLTHVDGTEMYWQ